MKSGLPIDVRKLLTPDGVESLRIEYKAEWNHVCGGSALRTICAFANDVVNAGGGYVVFGVDEQDGRPVLPARGLPIEQLDEIQKEIQGQINRIEPAYVPMIVPEQVGEATVLVLWCPGGDARPYRAPESLAKGAEKRSYIRTNSQTREARGELLRQLQEVASSTPFDDRGCYDASIDDLDPALLQQHLVKVGSRLAGDRADLGERAERLHLLKRVNGHSVPRNIALLFFSEEPRRWFRGAHIEIAQLPQGRRGEEIITRTIEGPLPTQVRLALDQLRALMPAEIRKLPDRAEAERIEAWPFAAVEEALVNAVHHRGYDVPDPIKVEVLPDALEIVSYPGPMPGLSLQDLREGRHRPVQARNRRIAELLRDLRLAEARGTGLDRIRSEMARNGSPPSEFDFDEESRSYFRVRLPIHPAFLKVAGTARPAQPLRLGRPAPPAEVVGRDDLIARVKRTLETQSVALVGPRGRGVSSLLGAVAASLSEAWVFQLSLKGIDLPGLEAAIVTWAESQVGGPVGSGEASAVFGRLSDRLLVLVLDDVPVYGVTTGEDWYQQEEALDPLVEWTLQHPHVRLLLGFEGPPWLRFVRSDGPIERIAVGPLDTRDAEDLALRLLLGAHLASDGDTAEALAHASAGSPELIVRLIAQLKMDRRTGGDAVELALDAFGVRHDDPTGLSQRVDAFERYLHGQQKLARAKEVLFDVAAAGDVTRRRLQFIAAAVTAGLTRLDAIRGLHELELEGWLCEVDEIVRFEHPWIRDAWLKFKKDQGGRGPQSGAPYSDEDIPF